MNCSHVGVAFITDIYIKEVPTGNKEWPIKYIARVGIAIMGDIIFKESEGGNPFDENFYDNYIEAKAMIKERAIEKIHEKAVELSRGLF